MSDNVARSPRDATNNEDRRRSVPTLPVARHGAPEGPSNNLPLQLTSFVGREREVAEVTGQLSETRLITLRGPGGCGKTRVALEVASEVAKSFGGGVWWVGLAPLSDTELVPQAVASVLNVREAPGNSPIETLVDYLETRRALLILDNCEHLVEACAVLTDALLRSCPNLRVLATSREALGVGGEVSWPVTPLSLPDPRRLLSEERLPDYESARLFVERARAVKPSFALDECSATAVARICYRLDGMPLAIELAAARAGVLSAEQISSRLEDSLGLLTAGGRTAEPRQKTLRAALSWELDLQGTGPEDRAGLMLAAALWKFWSSHGHLNEGRRWLERGLSTGGTGPQVRARALNGLGRMAFVQGDGRALASLEESLALFRELGDKAGVATSLGNLGLAVVFLQRDKWRLPALREEAEELRRAPLDRWATNHLLFFLALSAMDEGDYDRTAALAQEKLALNRELNDIHDITVALILSGMIALVRGDHERAADLFEEDLRLLRKLGDTESIIHCLLGLAGVAIPRGEPVRATRLWGAAEVLQEATGSLAASPFVRWGLKSEPSRLHGLRAGR